MASPASTTQGASSAIPKESLSVILRKAYEPMGQRISSIANRQLLVSEKNNLINAYLEFSTCWGLERQCTNIQLRYCADLLAREFASSRQRIIFGSHGFTPENPSLQDVCDSYDSVDEKSIVVSSSLALSEKKKECFSLEERTPVLGSMLDRESLEKRHENLVSLVTPERLEASISESLRLIELMDKFETDVISRIERIKGPTLLVLRNQLSRFKGDLWTISKWSCEEEKSLICLRVLELQANIQSLIEALIKRKESWIHIAQGKGILIGALPQLREGQSAGEELLTELCKCYDISVDLDDEVKRALGDLTVNQELCSEKLTLLIGNMNQTVHYLKKSKTDLENAFLERPFSEEDKKSVCPSRVKASTTTSAEPSAPTQSIQSTLPPPPPSPGIIPPPPDTPPPSTPTEHTSSPIRTMVPDAMRLLATNSLPLSNPPFSSYSSQFFPIPQSHSNTPPSSSIPLVRTSPPVSTTANGGSGMSYGSTFPGLNNPPPPPSLTPPATQATPLHTVITNTANTPASGIAVGSPQNILPNRENFIFVPGQNGVTGGGGGSALSTSNTTRLHGVFSEEQKESFIRLFYCVINPVLNKDAQSKQSRPFVEDCLMVLRFVAYTLAQENWKNHYISIPYFKRNLCDIYEFIKDVPSQEASKEASSLWSSIQSSLPQPEPEKKAPQPLSESKPEPKKTNGLRRLLGWFS